MKKRSILTLATGMWLAAVASASGQTTFTKITTGAIATDQGQFVRGTWADFNNDDFLDLVVCNWGGRTNGYYRNNGNGSFTKITIGDPVQDADYHVQANAGDYDNDGSVDLLVASGQAAPNPRRSMLYHNNGDGTFSRASGGGITNALGYFGGSGWADYDNDGFEDLFVTSYKGPANRLYHNSGDGTFTVVTNAPMASRPAGADSLGCTWDDHDNDGYPSPTTTWGFNFSSPLTRWRRTPERCGSPWCAVTMGPMRHPRT